MHTAFVLLLAALAAEPSPAPRPEAKPEARPQPPRPPLAPEDEAHLEALRKQIAGREKEPASAVFKDVQAFKEAPAERLLAAMGGFTRALGGHCSTCHDVKQWEADAREEKAIARRMMAMTRAINEEYLARIPEFAEEKEKPRASCMMCHRGSEHPKPDGPPLPKPAPEAAR